MQRHIDVESQVKDCASNDNNIKLVFKYGFSLQKQLNELNHD